MKLFGSLSELVSIVFRKNSQTITVRPNQATTYTAARDIQTPPQDANSILVSESATQSLTNKTLGVTNTLTGATSANFTNTGTISLPTVTDTLIGRISTDQGANRLKNKDLEDTTTAIVDSADTTKKLLFDAGGTTGTTTTLQGTQTANRILSFPDVTDAIVARSSTDTLTNKTLNAPVVSNYVELTEGSAPSTPASGKGRLFESTDGKLKFLNDDGLTKTLGDSGSGEINTISNSADATNWASSGAGVTVATTSSSTDLPLAGVFDTAIKITPVSGTDYAYYRFTMPVSLKNTKLKIQWAQRPLAGYATGDFKVDMYTNTASNYSGSYVRRPLSNDNSSAVTSVTDITGRFVTTFDSDTSDYYELRVTRVAGTTALNVTAVVVGPGSAVQGAAVSNWVSFTPTGSWSTNTTYSGQYRRVGDVMQVQTSLVFSGAPNNTALTVNLPTGFTVNTASLTNFGQHKVVLGSAMVRDEGTQNYSALVVYDTTSSVYVAIENASATYLNPVQVPNNTTPFTFGSTDNITIHYEVPIFEWGGQGLLSVLQEENLTNWIDGGVVTVYGSTTNPTKGSVSYDKIRYRRIGDTMECRVEFKGITGGSEGSGAYIIGIPGGLTIDTTKLSNTVSDVGSQTFGSFFARDTGAVEYTGALFYLDAGGGKVGLSAWAFPDNTTSNQWGGTFLGITGSTAISAEFRVPITQWRNGQNGLVGFARASASVMGLIQMSDVLDITSQVTGSNSWSTGGATAVIFSNAAQTQWAMNFAFSGANAGTATGVGTISITGLAFKTGIAQGFGGTNNTSPFIAAMQANTGNSFFLASAGGSATSWRGSGFLWLDSKPTWA